MKTMLLSFKPEVFEKIKKGEKIFEHRRVFPNEPIKAFIYVSRPIQAIMGIVYLNNRVDIESWKEQYSYDSDALKRIDKYLLQYRVAVQIKEFQNTSAITLNELKKEFPNFLIPQMYYFLDDLPLLKFLESNLKELDQPIRHNFDHIDSSLICVN
jgi:hypothetical protein